MSKMIFGYAPTHPGAILKEEIEYRKLSKSRLAEQMEISERELTDMLEERSPVTPEMAMLFEAALNVPGDALMRMQLKYNIQTAKQDKSFSARLVKVRQMAAATAL